MTSVQTASGSPNTPNRSMSADERAQQRRHLLQSAIDAVREVGPAVSMEDIAAAGGVTKPILYRHFGDRAGLVEAIGEQYTGRLVETMLGSLRDAPANATLWVTVDTFLALLEEDPKLYAFLMRQTASDAGDKKRTDIIEVISLGIADLLRGRWEAEGRDTSGVETIAFGIVGMVHHAGDRWVRSGGADRSKIASDLTDLLWLGFSGMRARHEAAHRERAIE